MINNPNIKGEALYGKKAGESTPCYIPFSKDSGDKPVIATEQYVDKHCKSLQEIIDALDQRVKELEGGDKPSPTPPTPKEEAVFKALFEKGEKGFIYDFNNLNSMFQDVNGKIPVTDVGQQVRKVLDTSGNENHLVCNGVAPVVVRNKTSETYYLKFTGSESLTCKKHNMVGSKALTILTLVTLEGRPNIKQEMYFKMDSGAISLSCFNRNSFVMRLDATNSRDMAINSSIKTQSIGGSIDYSRKRITTKISNSMLYGSISSPAITEIPDGAYYIGNSKEQYGEQGVEGGIYAMIGSTTAIADIDSKLVEAVDAVFSERAKEA